MVSYLFCQETESGHGIMEEPELTLVSTSDISFIEAEFKNLTLQEKNEGKDYPQVNFYSTHYLPYTGNL